MLHAAGSTNLCWRILGIAQGSRPAIELVVANIHIGQAAGIAPTGRQRACLDTKSRSCNQSDSQISCAEWEALHLLMQLTRCNQIATM